MPSGAVRLPGAAAVTAAGAGVVTAEPSWMAERRRRGNPSGVGPAQRRWPWPWPWPSRMSGRRTRHWSPVRVRCPPGGRLSTGSGGRPVSTRPVSTRPARSWCPDGYASGDRGPGVRAVRTALDPGMRRCGGAAHVWARRVRYVAVVGEWLGRRCPELGSGRKGWSWVRLCLAPTGSTADRPPVWIRGGCGVALAAGPTWELSSAGCRSVGGGTSKSSCSHVALQVRPGPVAGVMAGWAGRC
jgi:hypothetical protein